MALASTSPDRHAAGRYSIAFVGLAILALVTVKLIAAAIIEITPDETYYWLWSRFPAASYYDHPPMVAWWIAAGTAIFGDSSFGIRALFALSVIPASAAIYAAGRLLFDDATGRLGALWTNATILIGVGGVLATPDAPSLLFWSLAVLALVLVVRSDNGAWWLAVGALAGLGVLSKLTDLFLGLGLVLCLLADKRLRHWLANGWTWAGAVVAILVVTPMLVWNANHDWATLTKQFGRIGNGHFQLLEFPEFVAVQFGLLNPLLSVFAVLAAVMWIRGRPAETRQGLGILFWTVLPIIAYMALYSFRQQIEAHWLVPIFPTVALIAAVAATHPPDQRWVRLAGVVFPVGAAIALLGLFLATDVGGETKARLDLGLIIPGWGDAALEADTLRREAGAEWIATTYYVVNAEFAYHLRGETPVIDIGQRSRYAFDLQSSDILDKPALLVSRESDPAAYADCFTSVTPVGSFFRQSGGQNLEQYTAFLATGARADLLQTGCNVGR